MKVGKPREKPSYYGGDKVDADDEGMAKILVLCVLCVVTFLVLDVYNWMPNLFGVCTVF